MKLGLWLLVAAVAFLWFNNAKKQRLKNRSRSDTRPAEADATGDAAAVENVVACAHCGLHVPASDAVPGASGATFCCEAHRRLHPQA